MKKLYALILVAVLAGLVLGAGSISETLLRPSDEAQWTMRKVALDWLSDSSGDVSGTTTTVGIDGEIYRVVFQPDSSGTQPTDQYDVVLNDDDSMDVLLGLGADLSNAADTQIVPIMTDGTNYYGRVAVHGMLTLVVSNAGNAKGGIVIIYWK